MTHPLSTFLQPLYFISLCLSFLPRTLLKILQTRQTTALTSWSAFKELWFATFWSWYGPQSASGGVNDVSPLLRKHCRGIVLDVGPGAGNWLSLFTEVVRSGTVSKIYGVEPNPGHHEALRRRVKEAGLEGIYEVLDAKAGDLRTMKGIGQEGTGLGAESVDTVCTLQVLCSVPQPEVLIHELASYLKPGGSWIVYEHVKTKFKGEIIEYWQELLNLVWPQVFNGCNVNRDTIRWITREASWKEVKVGDRIGAENRRWEAVPGIQGYFIKA
jgi:SAM-dependent methyltransferase